VGRSPACKPLYAMTHTRNKIHFTIGQPENGWVKIKLGIEDFELEFFASNIPEDPLGKLYESLIILSSSVDTTCKISWNLEPNYYHFEIDKQNSNYTLKIYKSKNEKSTAEIIMKVDGDFNDILKPIYRGLRKFESFDINENDWKKIPNSKMEKLKSVFKDKVN